MLYKSPKIEMAREGNPLVLSHVIGDVLNPFSATIQLRLFAGDQFIVNGYRVRPSQVAACPRVEIGGCDFRTAYTLVMVDADSPSPGNPCHREYLHWLVTDIPGNTGPSLGSEIVSYEAPEPSMGIHRVVLVVFQQPVRRLMVSAPESRQNFNVRQFSEDYILGSPAAALYFNCHRENGPGGRRPCH